MFYLENVQQFFPSQNAFNKQLQYWNEQIEGQVDPQFSFEVGAINGQNYEKLTIYFSLLQMLCSQLMKSQLSFFKKIQGIINQNFNINDEQSQDPQEEANYSFRDQQSSIESTQNQNNKSYYIYYKILRKIVIILVFKCIWGQVTLKNCSNQNQYYDLSIQSCGSCQELCDSCNDVDSCVSCNQNFYQEQGSKKCVKQCQSNQYHQKFFQKCISCEIDNCKQCDLENNLCQICSDGWQLANDQKSCLKRECLENDLYYYNEGSGNCTTNCPEKYDTDKRMCVNIKKFSEIKTAAPKNQIHQDEITEIFYYQKLSGEKMIIALDDFRAVFYYFQDLIPTVQISLLDKYQKAIQSDSKNIIYLISQFSIQEIELNEMKVQYINQFQELQFWGFSLKNFYYQKSSTILAFSLQKNILKSYTINQEQNILFDLKFLDKEKQDITINIPKNVNQNDDYNDGDDDDQSHQTIINCPTPNNKPLVIIKSNDILLQRDFLQENNQILKLPIQQIECKFTAFELTTLNKIIIVSSDKTYIIDQKNTTYALNIQQINVQNLIDVIEYDNKIRFIIRVLGQFKNDTKSAIICSNLAYDQTKGSYFFEYEKPFFSKSQSQIIEHMILNNNETLIIATEKGYEAISIENNQNMLDRQKYTYIFNLSDSENVRHLKFLSKNEALIQYLVFAQKNQIIKINLNRDQDITYGSFIYFNDYQLMNGIQKLLISLQRNIIINILNTGFQVVQAKEQKILYEKTLYQQITNAEISGKYLGIVYKYQLQYNVVIFNLDTYVMQQFDISSTSNKISLEKQENPQILYIALYYADTIKLICISDKKIDIFQINATVSIINISQSRTLQALNNTVYISTLNYNVIVLAYDQIASSLNLINNIYSPIFYINIDNDLIIILDDCKDNLSKQVNIYSRIQSKEVKNVFYVKEEGLIENQIIYLSFSQYKFGYENLLGQGKMKFLDLKQLNNLITIYGEILAKNDQNFIVEQDNSIFTLFNSVDLSNQQITFPFKPIILSNIILIQDQKYVIIKNNQEQVYLYNVMSSQLVQQIKHLPANWNHFNYYQNEQLIFFESEYIFGYLILSQSEQKIILEEYDWEQIRDKQGCFAWNLDIRKAFFLDFQTNQLTKISINPKINLKLDTNSIFVDDDKILVQNSNSQPTIYDIYFNVVQSFANQTSVQYIKELDVFISINSNQNEILLTKMQQKLAQIRILAFTENISNVFYEAIFQQQNSLVLRINANYKSYLYLYDYFREKGNFINFRDKIFDITIKWKIVTHNNVLIVFLQTETNFFSIQKNGNYQLEKQIQNSQQFKSYFNKSFIFYNKKINKIIQYSPFSYYITQLQVFDYDMNIQQCQLTLDAGENFIHLNEEGEIYSYSQTQAIKVNYVSCKVQNSPLQGIKFLIENLIIYPSFIILDQYLDMLAIISQDKLNIFQKSTLEYLGSLDYEIYDYYTKVIYTQTTNIVSIIFDNQIKQYDLWSPFLIKLYQNCQSQHKNNIFLHFTNSNVAIYYNQNSGILNIHSNENNYKIIHQLNLKDSVTTPRSYVSLHKIDESKILIMKSFTEFIIYDFKQNLIQKQQQKQFNCRFYSSFQQIILCLEINNILKKFSYSSLEFEIVDSNLDSQLQLNQFSALSEKILSIVDMLGNLIIYDISTKQSFPILQSSQSYTKILQAGEYIITLNGQQSLLVFQFKQSAGNINLVKQMVFNDADYQIFDFLVIVLKSSYTLVFTSQQSVQVHGMESKQLIGQLSTPCRILTQMSERKSVLVESYSNLQNPKIYNFNFIFQDKLSDQLISVKLYCYSKNNLFDIDYKIKNNNLETNNVLLTFVQSENYLKDLQNIQDSQYRVYSQGLSLQKYIIKMQQENTDLVQINSFYDIFTDETIVEFQFRITSINNSHNGLANLNNNQFILPQFYNINFQSIALQVVSTTQNLDLNPNNNMKQIIFKDVQLVYFNETSCINISNLKTVILDNVIIQNSKTQNQLCLISISNVQNVLVQNLQIQNITIKVIDQFIFLDVKSLTFINLNITNSSIEGNLFKFLGCQSVSFQNVNVIDSKIISSGSILSFLKCTQIKFNQINFSELKKSEFKIQNISEKDNNEELDSNLIENYQSQLLNFQGCKNVILNNVQFSMIKDLTLIQAIHYSHQDEFQYYTSLFQINNCTANQITFSANDISREQVLKITSIKASILNITLSNIMSSSNLINWNVQKEGVILNSLFKNINLQRGSVLNMIDGQISLLLCNFNLISSYNSPSALNIQQASQVLIRETTFKNLRNENLLNSSQVDPEFSFEGGAIKAQNFKKVTIQSCLFYKCSALNSGGAIHSSNAQFSSTFSIQGSHFLENTSIFGSGGAVYFYLVKGIKINKTNFESNSANKLFGGAIYFESSEIQQFSNSIYQFNQAFIGGSIYYSYSQSILLSQQNLLQNGIIFLKNQARFYGQNIGSIPFWIGISEHPDFRTLQIVESYNISQISSGNYLAFPLYLNFIDEEKNPLDFTALYDKDANSENIQFSFKIYSQNESQVIIQQGSYAKFNQDISLFELNFQAIYKISQNQTIFLTSNTFDSGTYLKIPLYLQFRNCELGEIALKNYEFIQCIECPQGKYSLIQPGTDQDNQLHNQCNQCPQEAYFCQGKNLKLKDGFWRENNLTDIIHKCKLNSCSYDNPENINGCLEGYVGPICNSCDNKAEIWGRSYGFQNNQCYPCSSNKSQITYYILYFFSYFVYLLYTQYTIKKTKLRIYKLQILKKIDLLVTGKSSSSSSSDLSILFKLFINYVQILSCITEFNLNIPNVFNISINILGDPVKTSIKSLDCLAIITDRYPIWIHRISKMLIEGLFCVQIGNQYYLISDYTQKCNDYYYYLYELTFVCPLILIWCIIIPLRLFYKLMQFQKQSKLYIEESQNIKNILAYGLPQMLKFVQFKQVQIIRIHQLWKKVIRAYRNKTLFRRQSYLNLRDMSALQTKNESNTELNHRNIFQIDQNATKENSKQFNKINLKNNIQKIQIDLIDKNNLQSQFDQIELHSQYLSPSQNQKKPMEDKRIISTSSISLHTEQTLSHKNYMKNNTQNQISQREWTQSQMINSEACRLYLPQSFFENLNQNMNNQNYQNKRKN
ncbi:hypothetical protein ABPG74_020257 [Tetrahymena malaccensis]